MRQTSLKQEKFQDLSKFKNEKQVLSHQKYQSTWTGGLRNKNYNSTILLKKPNLNVNENAETMGFNGFPSKQKTSLKINKKQKISTIRKNLLNLKSKILDKIYLQEGDTVSRIQNFFLNFSKTVDNFKASLISNVTSFTQTVYVNLINSFIELEAEITEFEKEEEPRDAGQDEYMSFLKTKLQNFQKRISNYVFESTFFPVYEFEEKFEEKLQSIAHLQHSELKFYNFTEDTNLFLESIHDPFAEEKLKQENNTLEVFKKASRPSSIVQQNQNAEQINLYRHLIPSEKVNVTNEKPANSLYKNGKLSKNVQSYGSLHNRELNKSKFPGSLQEFSDKKNNNQKESSKESKIITNGVKMSFVAKKESVEIIDYSKKNASEIEVVEFLNSISEQTKDFYLDLSHNKITDRGLKLILRNLVKKSVVFLNLENNCLTDDSLGFFLSFVNYNTGLKGISIRGNQSVQLNDQTFLERKQILEEKKLIFLF